MKVKIFFVSLAVTVFSSSAIADSSDLVKGFAKYQAGRVENILLDQFIYDLANEKYLKQFFPATSKSISEYDGISGKRLIPLLSYYIEIDLEAINDLVKCVKEQVWNPIKKIDSGNLTNVNVEELRASFEALDWLLKMKKNASITTEVLLGECANIINKTKVSDSDSKSGKSSTTKKAASTPAAVSARPNASEKEVENTAKKSVDSAKPESIASATDSEKEKTATPANKTEKSESVAESISERTASESTAETNMSDSASAVENIFTNIYDQIYKKIEKGGESLTYSVQAYLENLSQKQEKFMSYLDNSYVGKNIDFPGFMEAIESLDRLKATNGDSSKKLYAVYVHQLTVALRALGFQVDDREGFDKFKSSSLFLASLAEAANLDNGQGPDAVAGVIEDFVNEDLVYKNKRNPVALYTSRPNKPNLRCSGFVICKNTWFLGSYYGLSMGWPEHDVQGEDDTVYRAFGPVGIEFKVYSGPVFSKDMTVTLMFAPIDIGVYVTDELKQDEYNVELDDIDAPSYFVSFSSKSSPMAVQVGYQKDIPFANNQKESMYFIAFSFDLPLVTLW